jgi:hypothetical protein
LDRAPALARSLAVASLFGLLSAPPLIQRLTGGDTWPYVITTIVVALVVAAVAFAPWEATAAAARETAAAPLGTTVSASVICAAVVVVICRRWLQQIFTIPIDAFASDMLVVIREGLRRALTGHNPYTIYHVPWDAPLPYGPLMWGPYMLPLLLRADLRFLTVAGQLFVPAVCAIAAVRAITQRRLAFAASAIVLLLAVGFSPDLWRFTATAHTPVYWPLLPLFAWFVAERRWHAAAVALGLLVVARSTMVAMVPIFLMATWQDDRRAFTGTFVRVVLASCLPLLPFAVWDWQALKYAMYGSYEVVIKTVVWPDPTVPHTIGLTGVLLSHRLQAWVEPVQVLVMIAMYAGSWFALRRRAAPLAVMSAGLIAFSMTTLWPVYYLYFDPFLLLTAALVVQARPAVRRSTPAIVGIWSAAVASVAIVVVVTGAAMLWFMRPEPALVDRDAPPMASIRVLRRSAGSGSMVDVWMQSAAKPVAATLNDEPVSWTAAENRIFVAAPASLWECGLNKLDLRFELPTPMVRVDVHNLTP